MKFNKHISFIIAFFLLVSNSGLAFNVHFCEGKIASVSSVFSKEEICETPVEASEKKCCVEKAKSHKSCCQDKLVNLEDESATLILKSLPFNSYFLVLIEEWNPIVFSSVSKSKSSKITSYFCDTNAPPFFKLYHKYIFYA